MVESLTHAPLRLRAWWLPGPDVHFCASAARSHWMSEQSVAAAGRSASACQNWASRWRARTVGLGQEVPLLDGRLVPYISLDNAASTPPLRDVVDAVQRFLPYYSSVHRGAGFKSRVSTAAYDDAHETLARFVGAETTTNTVDLREEHDGSHQQARLSLSARAAQRRSLDGDGAPLQRSPVARSRRAASAPA